MTTTEQTLPPLKASLYMHELKNGPDELSGVWLGCDDRSAVAVVALEEGTDNDIREYVTVTEAQAYTDEAVRNALERYPQPPTTDDEIGTLMHDIRNAVDLAGKGQWNAALEEVRNIKADLFRRKALAPQAPALTEEQREEILDEMVNTYGFSGGDTEQMVGLVIDATIDALAADSPVAAVVQAQAPALTDEQEIEAFSKWFGAVPDNASPQVLGIAHFAQNAWLARALLAAASPVPPAPTISMTTEQADSDSFAANRRSDVTLEKYRTLKSEAESRLTELLAQQEAVAWQPIETAPKDEIVLVAAEFDGPGDWRIKIGYFNPETERWNVWGASWAPTRWRRLPPPPEVRALTPLLETKE